MKIAAHIVATLLGLAFIAFGLMNLLGFMPKDPPPMPAAAMSFMAAMMPTGYMKFIALVQLLGGLMVVIPRTRNLGLLFLGPVIVNILAFHLFLTGGHDIVPGLVVAVLALFLLYVERRAWAGLVTRAAPAA
jgi:putative oxidoreductase